jgi:glucosamine--fructose-6-phosphate aminotransferase (isomerizing)
LEILLAGDPVAGSLGIGHTRWATHGPPCQRNAHPHSSADAELVVVQNGIVENFQELRRRLQAAGYIFLSDTDTEVIVHLIHSHYHNGSARDLIHAVRCAAAELEGPSAIGVLSKNDPDRLVVVRLGNAGGVVIGHGEGETFLASDIPALLPYTRRLQFLENRQMAILSRTGAEITDLAGGSLSLPIMTVDWDAAAAEKGEYRHFMQKEIFEQAESIQRTLAHRIDFEHNRVDLSELNLPAEAARRL